MSYQWVEDEVISDVPYGVRDLCLNEPENCREYIMYHGTTREAAQSILASGFRRSEDGMLGPGVYLSRYLEKAKRYPIDHPEHDKVVIKVVVKVGRVIAISYQGHPYRKTWHDRYGSAWVPPLSELARSSFEENCVWDPDRIQIISTIKPKPASGHDKVPA